MGKKWQTTVYLPEQYRMDVKAHKLDLSSMLTEQITYILGGQCEHGTMTPTVKAVKAKEVIRAVVPSLISEKYEDTHLMHWLPEADVHGDYEDRMMAYVHDVQRHASIDGHMSEILIFTRDYLATRDTPT